ncbi:methionine adenosyltransferase [Halonotius aquaticus]|uniref:S-adenosylmethionine synthase n=1 Tax=Halonotius aquaticus TaxID=2216978 RepID=A0A3A6PZ11_9EURY|nr:methionine adenosyltransferase [Halonotius aquaticus]RJX43496.1 methionine adenosyltransferase [Halonotius aquaticus]
MSRNIQVSELDRQAVEDQSVEIVERKGVGHPDSISDGVSEAVSRALSALYLDRVGKVLHYNTDETQLVAGRAAPAFGGGEVVEPIYLLIVGRATKEYDGQQLPVDSTALTAAREYLDETIPELDPATDVIVDVKLGEGSGDLQEVFGEDGATVPMANDTSFGVGHAPLTETEEIVNTAERKLNTEYVADNPEIGPDVKIMGKREGDHITITVAAAMVDAYIADLDAYIDAVEGVREYVTDLAEDITNREVTVDVNTADDYDEGSIYLTVTGTSAEQGDDGSVGRGNRANGLITPNRPMSMEATSGKNPVNHIGKIYNLLSTKIAESVVDEVDGIRDLQLRLLSQIGQPIDQPHVADAQVVTDDGVALADRTDEIEAIIDRELGDVTEITRQVIDGELSTF